jgi:hypothetical protein
LRVKCVQSVIFLRSKTWREQFREEMDEKDTSQMD